MCMSTPGHTRGCGCKAQSIAKPVSAMWWKRDALQLRVSLNSLEGPNTITVPQLSINSLLLTLAIAAWLLPFAANCCGKFGAVLLREHPELNWRW